MILSMVKRNLKCYFRDRASVFFSMLGVLIIIMLYALFLGAQIEGVASSFAGSDARFFIDSWIIGGVIAASSLTTTLGASGLMVTDQNSKIIRDFKSSPIKRWQLVLSYIVSMMIIGTIMSMFTFLLAEIYIVIHGSFVSFVVFLKVFGLVLLSIASSSGLVFLIATFIKSNNAFSALSTVVGTLIGFVTGCYIPIGNLPAAVQTVIKIFPTSHAAVLLRQIMMNEAVPLSYVPSEIKLWLGVNFEIDGAVMSNLVHYLVLAGTAVLFYLIAIVVVSRRKEKE